MKKFLFLIFTLLFAVSSHAAVVTVVQSGNSSASATWSATPTPSDTFVVPAGFTLTIDQAISFAGGTVESLTGGGLIINAKLTMTGALTIGNGSAKDGCLTFGPGSELALVSANVVLNNCRLRCTSTASSWAKVTGTGGVIPGTLYASAKNDADLRYVAFTSVGEWSIACGSTGSAALSNHLNATNITIVNATNITVGKGGSTAAYIHLRLNDSDIRDYTGTITLTGLDSTTGAREFMRNTVSISSGKSMRGVRCASTRYNLDGCVFDRVSLKTSAAGTSTDPMGQINCFLGSGIAADNFETEFGYRFGDGSLLEGSYIYVPPGAGNPHIGQVITGGSISDNVFEVFGSEPNIISSSTTALNTFADITNNVHIGTGALANQVGENTGTGTINVLHNTIFTIGNSGASHQGLWLSENGNFAGTVNIKSNIHAVASGIVCENSVQDNSVPGQAVSSDYNDFFGLSGSPYDGEIVANGTTYDTTVDPMFVDSTRSLKTWGAQIGVEQTYAAVVGELLRRNGYDPSTKTQALTPSGVAPADLVAWVRAGFAPTNVALQNAGHDSVTIGAVEYASAEPDPELDPGKYVSVGLYVGTLPLANLTGLTAIWWDAVPPSGNPTFTTNAASTSANGTITLNLTDYTDLNATQSGFLFVYEHNATDYRKSRLFGSQLPIWEQ